MSKICMFSVETRKHVGGFVDNLKKGILMKRRLLYVAIVCMMGLLLASAGSFAQSNIPQMINYQGMLTDAQGEPLATAEYSISFSIFPVAEGGNSLWGPQTFENVPVVRGHFNVILGPKDESDSEIKDAFSTSETYLEIKVGTTDAIAPRQRILSTPYAIRSGEADSAISANSSMTAKISDTVVAGSITSDKMAAKQVYEVGYPEDVLTVNTDGEFRVIPNLTIQIPKTFGRPILLGLASKYANGDNPCFYRSGGGSLYLRYLRDGVPVGYVKFGGPEEYLPSSTFFCLDTPPMSETGHVYTVAVMSFNNTLTMRHFKFIAYEL